MLRESIIMAGLLASACAPQPLSMSASEASEQLERFAAQAADFDVCSPDGRAHLRGAVRAYGAELARAGVVWPASPSDNESLRRMDAAVVVAFAAGFVEASDFTSAGRNAADRLALTYWPQVTDLRAVAHNACAEVLAVQQAAARVAAEMERYRRMSTRADPERLRRQRERVANAQAQLEALTEAVEAEVAQRARR